MTRDKMAEFIFNIEKEIAVLSTNEETGWQKVLTLTSFNNRKARLDIREWSKDRQKMAKGVALNDDEAAKLKEALNNLSFLSQTSTQTSKNSVGENSKSENKDEDLPF